MESDDALNYYLAEVKDTQHEINNAEEDIQIPNEAEQAIDFLQRAGLSDLNNLYQQGKEIPDNVVSDSVSQRNLTEKQAQTIRSRVKTLNRTLRSRQPRRKQRQDIRDITWKVETSSTGTRSRSATPDSLDSGELLNEDLTSDEDQQLTSLPIFSTSDDSHHRKTKIKWTNSEPLQNKKFSRLQKGDIANLESENVILKGYHVLSESGAPYRPPQRERSGSDPTTEVHFQPKSLDNSETLFGEKAPTLKLHTQLSRSHNSITSGNNCSKVYINGDDDKIVGTGGVSFEGLLKQNDCKQLNSIMVNGQKWEEGVKIDSFSDSEYQYLKPLIYVELIAIFDQYKIAYLKRKASSKNKGGSVFGVNLSTLVMRDMPRPTENSMVPEIFRSIIDQLNNRCIGEDGILRVAGQKQKLESLCNEIENKFFNDRLQVENLLKQATVHELTGVLKKLLRDLPDPIFTMELFEMFYKTSEITSPEDKLKALNMLVLLLPVEHRNTYRLLLEFFLNIAKHEKENRMNLHNVAMITAPSFFVPRLLLPKNNDKLNLKHLTKEELHKQINGAAVCCSVMETMLRAGDKLWTVPSRLAEQARAARMQKAQTRKEQGKDKDKNIRSKTKLVRSSTQYEPMNSPRKREIFL